jgi:hypothetical protein
MVRGEDRSRGIAAAEDQKDKRRGGGGRQLDAV